MATIRKRNDRYHVQVRKTGLPHITQTFTKLADARAWARTVEGDHESGKASPRQAAKKVTVGQLLDEYAVKAEQLRDWLPTQSRIKFWRERMAKLPLSKLSGEMIEKTLADYDCAPATKNRLQNCLRQALKPAVKRGLLPFNPAGKDYATPQPEPTGRERVLAVAEWERLRAAAAADPCSELAPFLRVLWGSAMRAREPLSLTSNLVDVERRVAHLPRAKTGERLVVLTADAADALREVGCRFTLTYDQLRHAFRRARAAAGLGDDVLFHTFRHSVATRLGAAGANTIQIAAVTGHRSLSSLRRYVKDTEQAGRAALDMLA